MPSVPSAPTTAVAGQAAKAGAQFNALAAQAAFALAPPLAILVQTVAQGLTTSFTDILFDSETIDRDGGHSTSVNTARYTAQTPGWYHIDGSVLLVAGASAVDMAVRLLVNNSVPQRLAEASTFGGATLGAIGGSRVLNLGAGDYVTLQAAVSSARNTNPTEGSPFMCVRWVSS